MTQVALKSHVRAFQRSGGDLPLVGETNPKGWARRTNDEDMLRVGWQDGSESMVPRKDLQIWNPDDTPFKEVMAHVDQVVRQARFATARSALDDQLQERQFRVGGVGPDVETITHANGAKESKAGFAATSLPPKALLAVAAVQQHGDDKYGVDNWRDLTVLDHLNHAQIHYLAYMAGDKSDQHLEHYATRALMALELMLEEKGVVGE